GAAARARDRAWRRRPRRHGRSRGRRDAGGDALRHLPRPGAFRRRGSHRRTPSPARMRALVAWLCLFAAGCTAGPDYERPTLELPQDYLRAPADAPTLHAIADVPWWQVFEDPQLDRLVEKALRENLDLRLAAAQILEAQAGL